MQLGIIGAPPNFLAALDDGLYDLVSGWKYPRQDPLTKILPSRLFNLVTSLMKWLHSLHLRRG
jgi:hypothetical protein